MKKNLILNSIAFIGGMTIMILELIGSRILAPYVGASVFTWTSLIGIILVSMSVGYSWGGKLADKRPQTDLLGFILFTAGIGIAWTVFSEKIFQFAYFGFLDVRLGSILLCIILFVPATIALAMISPFLVRLKLHTLEKTGATVGNISTLSTAGSILGTFLGGYFLVSYLRTDVIIFSLSVLILLTSLTVINKKTRSFVILFIVLEIFLFSAMSPKSVLARVYPHLVADIDTAYSRYWVFDEKDPKTQQGVRLITNNYKAIQSGIYLNSDALLAPYSKVYDLARYFVPNAEKFLMLGGGVFSYPKHFLKTTTDATMDVVEIDPALKDIGEKYFGYENSDRITVYNEDGRMYLAHTKNTYDVVLIDVFSSYATLPLQLTTQEAVQKISDHLTDKGVVIVNIVGALEGDMSGFIKAEYTTYKEVFPHVYLLPLSGLLYSNSLQNIMLIASKKELQQPTTIDPDSIDLLKKIHIPPTSFATTPLTDQLAPIEKYTINLLNADHPVRH